MALLPCSIPRCSCRAASGLWHMLFSLYHVLLSTLQLFPDLLQLCLTSGPLHRLFSYLRQGSPPFPASRHSSSRTQSQACIILSAPSNWSYACSGKGGAPLGLPLMVVLATCLVSPVTALGLLSGRTVSPLRAGIWSPDPRHVAHRGVWLVFMEWMKNGLQSPLLFLLLCAPTVCTGRRNMSVKLH